MIISEVLLVVGALVVAMFGFLNGWLVRRLFSRADDLSVDDVSIYPGPSSARWANGPRAALFPTRGAGELETAHDRGMTAVATFADEPEAPPSAEMAQLLARREAEIATLLRRIELLEQPVDRQGLREEWLGDLSSRHGASVVRTDAGLSRCEERISGLESVLGELDEMVTSFDARGDLERRIEVREERRRARRRDRAPSMSAV